MFFASDPQMQVANPLLDKEPFCTKCEVAKGSVCKDLIWRFLLLQN